MDGGLIRTSKEDLWMRGEERANRGEKDLGSKVEDLTSGNISPTEVDVLVFVFSCMLTECDNVIWQRQTCSSLNQSS